MSSFKLPENVLDDYQLDNYQLELCESAFRQAWSEIVPRRRQLPKSDETRLQDEISQRLCALASQGLSNPDMLIGLTVATVGLRERVRLQSRIRHRAPKSRH